ncbi:hypothetical protein [Mucilaginibacter sp. FT3.2]|uniref:hypothetical protein n=1 Tax=Mucilaginibacter sp. FT3.2 TaxID=2723090 RepID=UPI00160C21DB|nr:hypothetical protein [Mucilaginibacter sp. FT3.2]MBB6234927.1 hypothetical protein [Mucilaginibacter sp. FT3.2]
MKRKNIIITIVFLSLIACRKEKESGESQTTPASGLTLDQVKNWYQTDSSITIDWQQAEHHQTKNTAYWLVGVNGRPGFGKLKLGYRRLVFYKNNHNQITEQILEIIPDALYLQRVKTVSATDFTGRIFIFDRKHLFLGGLSYRNGQQAGSIKPASQDTSRLQVNNAELDCSWFDSNYVDSDGNAVIYSESVCDPIYLSGGSDGFGDGSTAGYSPVSSGDAAPVGHGGTGGSSGNSAPPPAVSNLPGESGPGISSKDFMKCFGNIPDQGATMKITVYVQEPWPGTTFNIGPNSVGHTAIGLTKINGSQTVTQVVGFYPDATGLDKMHAPSKVVNNGGDLEYNVSITYTVSADNFQKIRNYIADPPATYDLTSFNCTSFVYQACQSGNITLPDPYSTFGPASPPGGPAVMAPAGIGDSISNMKGQSNVNTNGGITPNSKGACQ